MKKKSYEVVECALPNVTENFPNEIIYHRKTFVATK